VPATVTAGKDELLVKADNSSLTQILHQVSSVTGMQLDGLGGDERVFGSFGPGAPREVLSALLNGTSYNVMMVGALPNGAPRQLLLTGRSATGAQPAAQPPPNANQANSENGDSEDPGAADDASEEEPPQPPPPMQNNPPAAPSEGLPPGPRTPQQIMQQMQQMRNVQNAAPQQ
jgi:hypothetical protein